MTQSTHPSSGNALSIAENAVAFAFGATWEWPREGLRASVFSVVDLKRSKRLKELDPEDYPELSPGADPSASELCQLAKRLTESTVVSKRLCGAVEPAIRQEHERRHGPAPEDLLGPSSLDRALETMRNEPARRNGYRWMRNAASEFGGLVKDGYLTDPQDFKFPAALASNELEAKAFLAVIAQAAAREMQAIACDLFGAEALWMVWAEGPEEKRDFVSELTAVLQAKELRESIREEPRGARPPRAPRVL